MKIRKEAGDLAEHLIGMLDAADRDFDLEETGDAGEGDADGEPSLGWTATRRQEGRNWTGQDWAVDVEAEHDGREPDVDTEANGDELDENGDERDDDRHNYDHFPDHRADEFGNAFHVGFGQQWWQEPHP